MLHNLLLPSVVASDSLVGSCTRCKRQNILRSQLRLAHVFGHGLNPVPVCQACSDMIDIERLKAKRAGGKLPIRHMGSVIDDSALPETLPIDGKQLSPEVAEQFGYGEENWSGSEFWKTVNSFIPALIFLAIALFGYQVLTHPDAFSAHAVTESRGATR